MNLKRSPRTVFTVFFLPCLGFSLPVSGQTIYAPYAITNLGGSPGGTFLFNSPYDVAIYRSTNIYVAATYDHTIRKLTLQGGTNWVASLFAGSPGNGGNSNGVGSNARFTYPEGVAVDKSNNVYVADSSNGRICKITPDANVTTLADLSPGFPINLAVDSAGNVYVSVSATNSGIRKISPGGDVSLFVTAAPGTVQWRGGVGVDQFDNVFAADYFRNSIYKITPGGAATLIAGTGSHADAGSADGIGPDARFNVPNDVCVSTNGDVFVADAGNSTLRRIRFDGSNWVVRTIAGTPGVFGSGSGVGPAASFRNLAGLVVDDNTGILYAADIVAGTIRAGVYVGPSNEFNSWTNATDGGWDDALNWSAGVAPSVQDEQNYITNAGSKNVYIDSGVAATNLNIYNLTISSPGNDVNALALVDVGAAKQLYVQQTLKVDSGGNVTLLNSALKVGLEFDIGFQSGGAVLDIQGGGRVTATESYVGNQASGGSSVNVGGTGAAWTNQQVLVVGNYSPDNGVLIENGGRVVNLGLGAIGVGASNNTVAVTGAGSEFRNASYLIVGDDGGSGNEVSIQNGGKVYVGYADGSELDIGTGGGDNNSVFVTDPGSQLTCSGPLQLTRGGGGGDNKVSIFAGGKVTTVSLVVSNLNSVELGGGTLETGGTIIDNGIPLFVGIGVEPTTLRLNGGSHTFTDGLIVTDHALLTGCGTIVGPVTVEPGGTVIADCGTLTFTGPVTNSGTILPVNGTNVVFPGGVVNFGSILTNSGSSAFACPIIVTGAIVNLMDSPPTPHVITDGTNSVQFNWSVASPGNSGWIYTTFNTAIALATGVTNIADVTNAAVFAFTNSNFLGPVKDAAANSGVGQFVLLRNKNTGHYAAVRMDDVQANGNLNATWWFQSQSGSTNFGCVPPPPPAGPSPATNLTMQAGGGNLNLSFVTQPGRAYTVQMRTNLTSGTWISVTNFPGDGSPRAMQIVPANLPRAYYRILTQ